MHLGHSISSGDRTEIVKYAKRSFWSSFNIFRADFGHISSRLRNVLFQKYGCVFYGSPLWLLQLMDTVVEESEAKGLFLNSAKSFTMVFSKSEVGHTCKITVHGNTLEQVNRFVYLGSLFTSDGRCEQDVGTTENCHREISIHIVGESSEE